MQWQWRRARSLLPAPAAAASTATFASASAPVAPAGALRSSCRAHLRAVAPKLGLRGVALARCARSASTGRARARSLATEMSALPRTYTTTVMLCPPPHLWAPIQQMRVECDDVGLARWPPHLNLVYPFVSARHFKHGAGGDRTASDGSVSVTDELARGVRDVEPFTVELSDWGIFTHGRRRRRQRRQRQPPRSHRCAEREHANRRHGCERSERPATLYLAPRDAAPIVALRDALQSAMKRLDNNVAAAAAAGGGSGNGGTFTPHLTISHFDAESDAVQWRDHFCAQCARGAYGTPHGANESPNAVTDNALDTDDNSVGVRDPAAAERARRADCDETAVDGRALGVVARWTCDQLWLASRPDGVTPFRVHRVIHLGGGGGGSTAGGTRAAASNAGDRRRAARLRGNAAQKPTKVPDALHADDCCGRVESVDCSVRVERVDWPYEPPLQWLAQHHHQRRRAAVTQHEHNAAVRGRDRRESDATARENALTRLLATDAFASLAERERLRHWLASAQVDADRARVHAPPHSSPPASFEFNARDDKEQRRALHHALRSSMVLYTFSLIADTSADDCVRLRSRRRREASRNDE